MRVKLRNRYYCDHCNKAGGSAGHMRTHEKHCTANPHRSCRICDIGGFDSQPLVDLVQLVRKAENIGTSDKPFHNLNKEQTTALREATGGCPVCMLAALRQGPGGTQETFNLREELAEFWKGVNEERAEIIGYVG